MTISTTDDVIKAAASIARDAADGKLSPEILQAQAVAELRQLVGEVAGPGDPLWPLQLEIARGVLAVGGIEPDELAEWLAVERQRAGEPLPAFAPPVDLLPAQSLASVDESPDSEGAEAVSEPAEPEPVASVAPQPQPKRRANGYDPLAGWAAGRRGFLS